MIWADGSAFDRCRPRIRTPARRQPLRAALALAQGAPVATLLVLLALASLTFALFPGLDLAVSGLFAVPGEGFPLARNETLLAIRDLNRALPIWIAVALLVALLGRGVWGARSRLPPPHALLHVLGVYLVACLGIVHILKNTMGRARPEHILAFGGDKSFTLPWQISNACHSNCSFSSGEAASAMAMLALAYLAPRGWRAPVALALALPGLVFSLNRIAFGSHFLSDVVISWLIVAATILALRSITHAYGARIDAGVDGQWREPLLGAARHVASTGRMTWVRTRWLFLRAAA
ncbi:phosphatase PAP2 family protein [Aureimonas ureilytica]|uniref:phosphatase PAP2 family protein n=1 Tax=Aureimonas ureilytica TaxID=401562 RepID=UPI0009EB47B6|nr:phosphatase PAP2 family protein [Aureimonas ureilytica]